MNKIEHLKFLPHLLLLFGIYIWINALSQKNTNNTEAKIHDIWERNFNKAVTPINYQNDKIRLDVNLAITKRTKDMPLLDAIDSVLVYEKAAIQSLEQLTAQETTIEKIALIIENFNKKSSMLSETTAEKIRTITPNKIKELKNRFHVLTLLTKPQKSYLIALAKNTIQQNTNTSIIFFAKEVGGSVLCCYGYISTTNLPKMLRIGQTYKGNLFISDLCDEVAYYRPSKGITINQKHYPIKDGLLMFEEIFKDTTVQSLVAETMIFHTSIQENKVVNDTIFQKDTLYIHPINQ